MQPFLLAAALALLALALLALVLLAFAAVVAVVVPYAALGGGTYAPAAEPDPCKATWPETQGLQELPEQLALTGFALAACKLDVSR